MVVDNPGTGASHVPAEGNAITRFVCAEAYRQLAAQILDNRCRIENREKQT